MFFFNHFPGLLPLPQLSFNYLQGEEIFVVSFCSFNETSLFFVGDLAAWWQAKDNCKIRVLGRISTYDLRWATSYIVYLGPE